VNFRNRQAAKKRRQTSKCRQTASVARCSSGIGRRLSMPTRFQNHRGARTRRYIQIGAILAVLAFRPSFLFRARPRAHNGTRAGPRPRASTIPSSISYRLTRIVRAKACSRRQVRRLHGRGGPLEKGLESLGPTASFFVFFIDARLFLLLRPCHSDFTFSIPSPRPSVRLAFDIPGRVSSL
jgi:hypothetical protein